MNISCISINDLNDDCLLHIFTWISARDRLIFESVCRRWRKLCTLSWKSYRTFDITDEQLGYQAECGSAQSTTSVRLWQLILVRCYSYLKRVNISGDETIYNPDKAFILGHYCLKRYTEKSRKRIETLNVLKTLLSKCRNIEELNLCFCVISANDKFLESIFKNNKKIRAIWLAGYNLTGKCFIYLPSKSLESLDLLWCDLGTKYNSSFAPILPKLHSLLIKDETGGCDFMNMITSHPLSHLRQLILIQFDDIPQSLVSGICRCVNLTFLTLRDVYIDDSKMMLIITSCTKVIHLDISSNEDLTDASIFKLKSLPHLKYLEIAYNQNFTDTGLMSLNEDLKFLDLTYSKCSSTAILAILRKMLNLKELNVECLKQLDERFAESAIDIVKLRPNNISLEIHISDTSIVPRKVKNVCSLVYLDDEKLVIKPQLCNED